MAPIVSTVLLFGVSACQHAAPAATASAAVAPENASSRDLPKVRTPFDRTVLLLEERTGERLSLTLSDHDYSAVYPAWLPDNRLVVPGARGVTIVEPRSGTVTPVSAKGRRAIVSPDGKTMAIASTNAIELLDVAKGQSLTSFEASIDDSDERAMQFSPNGRLFGFPLDEGREIGIYDVDKRALRGILELATPSKLPSGLTAKFAAQPEPGDAISTFELRNERVLATLASGSSALWDSSSLAMLLLVGGARDDGEPRDHRALLSDDGALAAVWTAEGGAPHKKASLGASEGAPRGVIRAERRSKPVLVDAQKGEVVMRLEDKQCVPFGMAMHPKQPLLAVGSLYPGFCVWDLAKRKIQQRFRIPQASKDKAPGPGLMLRLAAKMSPKMDLPIEHVTFDPKGELVTLGIAHLGGLVVRLADGTISDGALSKDSHLEDFPASAVATRSPDQSMIAGSGNELRVWDVASGRVLRRIGQHEKHSLLGWTPDAVTIVGIDGTVIRFRTDTGELAERRPRPATFDDVKTISNGAGALVMLSSRPAGLRAMRVDAPGPVVPLAWPGAVDEIIAAASSGNGQRIAVSASDALAVFDATTGTSLRVLEARAPNSQEAHAPTIVALDDEGQLVAALVQDTARVWEVASGREIQLSPGDCTDLKFQPKTHLLAGACRDQVRVWDARTGAAVSAVDNGDLPEGLFFDATGSRMAQLGAKYLTLLDGRTLNVLNKTESALPTWTAVFSPSARFIAVGVQNGEGVEFYRAQDGKKLARLQMWPNDEAWVVRTDEGKVEILGDVERVRQELQCRVGAYELPMEACDARLLTKGLLGDILSERVQGAPRE